MSGGRRLVAIAGLFLVGFGMIALADALDETWPLFVTTIPYAFIPWIIVRHEREVAGAAEAHQGA